MDIVGTIVKSLNGYIFNLSEKISSEYNIPIEDILKIWCEQNNTCFQTVFVPMIKISKKQKKITNTTPPTLEEDQSIVEDETTSKFNSPETIEEVSNVCSYIFIRGHKKDQRCTIISKAGNMCSKHKK